MSQEEMHNIVYKTKSNDIDDAKGIVKVGVNGIGVKDADGDISAPGSFDKTLKENFSRVKWLYNHDRTILLGCPIEGNEENGNLVMVGKINLKKEIGRDVFEDYKLYAEYGKTLEHSIGVKAIKRDIHNKSIVKEWSLWEYSTLSSWGANPQTFLMDIKNLKNDDIKMHINMMRKALNMRYSNEKLKGLENNLDLLEKALIGNNIVQCHHCGLAFDYNSVPEETLESQVIEAVGNYTRWETEDIVREEMQKIKPEIQERILNIINSKKSIENFMSNVRCPKCYTRIYKTNTLISEPSDNDTQEEKSRHNSTLSLKKLGNLL